VLPLVSHPEGAIELVTQEYYPVHAQVGEKIADVIQRVNERLTGNPRKQDLNDLLDYTESLIWVNFDPEDQYQKRYYTYLQEHSDQLNKVRGKQSRKDQERIKDLAKEFRYTCEDLLAGRQ